MAKKTIINKNVKVLKNEATGIHQPFEEIGAYEVLDEVTVGAASTAIIANTNSATQYAIVNSIRIFNPTAVAIDGIVYLASDGTTHAKYSYHIVAYDDMELITNGPISTTLGIYATGNGAKITLQYALKTFK